MCAAIIAVGTIAIYGGSLSVPLLFDDIGSIADNLSIRRLWPVGPVLSPPADTGVGGRPLLNLSYALNYAFCGTAVRGYHLANILVHVLAGWTLFALARRILLRPGLAGRFGSAASPLALAIGAIWSWHPAQTEAVTYLTQRSESLMGLFYLVTLYCFMRGAGTETPGGSRSWFALCVLACLAGMAAKEVMVTAPLMVFLMDRTFVSGSFTGAWRRHWPLYVALAATWLPLGCLMMDIHRRSAGFGLGIAWWAYALVECRVVVSYLLLALWPHPLVFDYGWYAAIPPSEAWPCVLVLVSLVTAAIVALLRSPAAGFAACWFFLVLAPTSSIVPLIGQPMAEHRLYLPLAGAVAGAVLGAFALAGRRILPAAAAVAVGLALASAHRNRDYSSDLAIWADTVAKTPDNARAHNNLGGALLHLHRPDLLPSAAAEATAALRLKPDYAEAHNNLGSILDAEGRPLDAISRYEEALRLKPNYAEAHNNLGKALEKLPGRLNDAIAQYGQALRIRPDLVEAHNNLGSALEGLPGRLNDAIAQYEEALRLKPDLAETHYNLGNALNAEGRAPEAAAQYEEALRLQPDLAEAHNNLGSLLSAEGRVPEAIAQFEEALRLRQDYAEAHLNLAIALLRVPGRGNEARTHLEEVLRLQPKNEPARQILAEIRESGP